MMKIGLFCLALVGLAATAHAQPRPGAFTTITATDTSVAAVCVGCPVGSTTPAANSGLTAATVVLANGAPTNPSFKLYQVAGTLFFNGTVLATGSSVSGTTGTLSKFTSPSSLGNSLITESGSTITIPGTVVATLFSGSGTSLTGVGLLAGNNTWSGRQILTPPANSLPMQITGSDSATSGVALSLGSNASGRSSVVHFTDNVTYNAALGVDGGGNFNYWANRFPGGSGTSVFSVSTGGTVATSTINASTINASGVITGNQLTSTGNSTTAANSTTLGVTTSGSMHSLSSLTVDGGATLTGTVISGAIHDLLTLQVDGTATLGSTFITGSNGLGIQNAGISMNTWPTTAAAANAVVGNFDVLRASTSLRANKHDIDPIGLADARHTVMGLRAVLYESAIDEDQRPWAGFIAEEVEAVNPTLAVYRTDGALQSVTYDRVPAYLLPVVQDQERRIEALEAALKALQ